MERSSSARHSQTQRNQRHTNPTKAQQMRPPFQGGWHAFRKLSYFDCFTRRDGGFRSALPKILSIQPNSKIRPRFSSIIYIYPRSGNSIISINHKIQYRTKILNNTDFTHSHFAGRIKIPAFQFTPLFTHPNTLWTTLFIPPERASRLSTLPPHPSFSPPINRVSIKIYSIV